jgi:rhodanese-related sulfurtransferase
MKTKLLLVVLLGALVFGMSCSDDKSSTSPTTTDEFETIRVALDAYTADASTAPTIAAADLYTNLNDGDTSNDPYILSVRANNHYQLGHIPGAHNIPWRDIADVGATSDLPTDKQVVVYCYTGHTGAIATTILQAMGYNAVNLKYGICSWTQDADVRATTPFTDATDAHDYTLETTANTPPATNDLPSPDFTTSNDAAEIIRAASEAYAGNTALAPTISAQDLYTNLNDGDTSNDPIILSVRSATHYALGHIPGAINIPWREICDVDKLKMLDPDKQIVVYCYTGHTGGVATTALNLMGYNAINLKHGICSWTRDTTVRATQPFSEDTDAHNYPLETGP